MSDVCSFVAPEVSILCTEGAQHISLGQRPGRAGGTSGAGSSV